jgi:hypothetical protein
MTFLEALYGGQYYELRLKGRDGNKGRLNANLFLSALVILLFFVVIMIAIRLSPAFNESLSKMIKKATGGISGRSAGKILAVPLFALTFFTIQFTVGSKENFNRKVEAFLQYPDELKKKANGKMLTPFFIILILFFTLAMYSVFSKR